MKFVETPYLPENDVQLCVAGNGIKPFEDELLKLGINTIITVENQRISPNIANHADLVMNYSGSGNLFADNSQKNLITELNMLGFDCKIIDETVSGEYPKDCLLNCIFSDEYLICNSDCTSKNVLNFAKENNKTVLNVKQGYVKCSICPVEKNAVITDDESIYKVLTKNKFDVLLIKKGNVVLKGYDYGFFGGCCGKISEKNIAFLGDIKKHSCYDNIKAFTKNYGIELISLGNKELVDIGSLIPIAEKE